jgi:hypothetical protein
MRKIGWRVSIKSRYCDRPVIIECDKFTLTPELSLILNNVSRVKIGITDITGVLYTDSNGHITIKEAKNTYFNYQSIIL